MEISNIAVNTSGFNPVWRAFFHSIKFMTSLPTPRFYVDGEGWSKHFISDITGVN